MTTGLVAMGTQNTDENFEMSMTRAIEVAKLDKAEVAALISMDRDL